MQKYIYKYAYFQKYIHTIIHIHTFKHVFSCNLHFQNVILYLASLSCKVRLVFKLESSGSWKRRLVISKSSLAMYRSRAHGNSFLENSIIYVCINICFRFIHKYLQKWKWTVDMNTLLYNHASVFVS